MCVDKPLKWTRRYGVRLEQELGDLLWVNIKTGKAMQMQFNFSSKEDSKVNRQMIQSN